LPLQLEECFSRFDPLAVSYHPPNAPSPNDALVSFAAPGAAGEALAQLTYDPRDPPFVRVANNLVDRDLLLELFEPAGAPPGEPPKKSRWPPPFPEAGAAYVFDAASGFFYEPGKGFFYDPKTGM
jgi:hypothetical protein